MRTRLSLLALFAVAVAACNGSGQPEDSPHSVKRSADGLIIVPPVGKPHDPIPDPTPEGLGPDPKRYIICWDQDGYEQQGYYDFVVHPTQLFLRNTQTHSLSKKEYLYWVQEISPEQYRAISDYLDREVNENFVPETARKHAGYTLFRFKQGEPIPLFSHSNGTEMRIKLFIDISNRNIENVLKELNSGLPREVKPLFRQASIATGEAVIAIQ